MKLIAMTDFVFKQNTDQSSARRLSQIIAYAEFLKQPLTLGMFVPCFETDEIFYKPFGFDSYMEHQELSIKTFTTGEIERCKLYQKAKEKVLFDGFKVSDKTNCINGNLKILRFEGSNQVWAETKDNKTQFRFPNLRVKTVEDLDHLLLELTESAIKQIGL